MGARASRREWIGLAVLTLPCFLLSMDLTVLSLALPALLLALGPVLLPENRDPDAGRLDLFRVPALRSFPRWK